MLLNLFANTFVKMFTSVQSRIIGLYYAGCAGSFLSLGITIIVASVMDARSSPLLNASLRTSSNSLHIQHKSRLAVHLGPGVSIMF